MTFSIKQSVSFTYMSWPDPSFGSNIKNKTQNKIEFTISQTISIVKKLPFDTGYQALPTESPIQNAPISAMFCIYFNISVGLDLDFNLSWLIRY